MVRFPTTRFGTLEVDEGRVITFPEGLLGFADLKRYILMDYRDTTVKWLQAVDEPDVAFIVTEPTSLMPDFTLRLDAATRVHLQLEREEDLGVLVILRVEDGKVVANFQGPLLLNAALMRGVQAVLEKPLTQ